MEEKRKFKRLPLKLELTISDLFKQDYQEISDLNTSIEVHDISKSGLGFTCNQELPIGFYFDAKIQLTDDKHFFAVLKIVRVDKLDSRFWVGCEFVGLADVLSSRIDEYSQGISD